MTPPRPLIDTDALADWLGVPARTLEQWRWRSSAGHKLGPAYHTVGRAVRYAPEDVEAWLAGRKTA